MTLNGAIMQLVEMRENSMMPICFKPYFDKVIETISECEEPNSQSKWIPCSERLPELYKPVLVTGGDIIWICELIESPDLDDGEFQWEDKMLGHWYSFDNWDAWQPLPEPWKGGEE